jgi:hypothetical protein
LIGQRTGLQAQAKRFHISELASSKGSNKYDEGSLAISKPKDQYGSDGNLIIIPELNRHFMSIKPRESHSLLQQLLLAYESMITTTSNNEKDTVKDSTKAEFTAMETLLDFVKSELVEVANSLGAHEYTITQRVERQLSRQICCISKGCSYTVTGGHSALVARPSLQGSFNERESFFWITGN